MKRKVVLMLYVILASIACCAETVSITLEHAKSFEEMMWGLMGRTSLPQNHGMLFTYPEPKQISLWSFNCEMDLAVAFIDDANVIKEIAYLKAYPGMMDPKRPVKSVYDIGLYSREEPIVLFFMSNSIKSRHRCRHALEMDSQFFRDNGVKEGAKVVWKGGSAEIHFPQTQPNF